MADTPDRPKTPESLHAQALDRFKLVAEVESDQRRRELEVLEFQAGDMWPADVKKARSGQPATGGQPFVPARPMITVRSLEAPIQQVVNQARNARLGITVTPKGEGASQEAAEVFEGLIREIEYQSHAQNAYLWAYQRAVPAGRGFFRIDKEYALEDPDPNDPARLDQTLRIRRILNQATVYLDPFAQMPDWSDGEWAFVTEDIPEDRYKRTYKDSKLANADDAELTAKGDQLKDWIRGDGAGKSYRIAEYWFCEYEKEDITETEEGREDVVRTAYTRKIMWAKINGMEFLEEPQEWDGQYIPIPPVLANEYNLGGKRIFEGLVAPAMGPCQMLNYMVSAAAEQIGLASKAPYIGYEGQFEGHEEEWDQANVRNLSRLTVSAVTDATGSQVLPLPTRNLAEPPIQAMSEMIGLFTNFIRSTTSVPDAALGNVNVNDKSGKAIRALQQASEQGTSNYLDGLSRAIQYAGVVLVDLIPHIYDRPGRKVQTRTEDGQLKSVLLGVPFVEIDGNPVPLPPGVQPPQGMPVKVIDLSKGQYSVVVEVGKAYATQLEAAQAAMDALAQAAPELVPRWADLWVENMPGVKNAKAIAARLKPPGVDGPDNVPPELKQAISQLQQENQQLKMALQTKQAEQQAKVQTAQIDAESRERVAAMQEQTKLVIQEAKINAENSQALLKAEMERIGKILEERMVTLRTAAELQHDAAVTERAQHHEAVLTALDQAHEHVQNAAEREHAKELASQKPVSKP